MPFAIPQVKRRAAGNVEQENILVIALHAAVNVGQGVAKIVRYMLIKLVILLFSDLALGTSPQG